jgi:transposase
MIALAPGTKVFLACQPIDLRAGFDGLAAKVRQIIGADPFSGHVFIFRGKRGHYLKGPYWDGSGCACLPSDLSATSLSGRQSSTAP